MQETHEHYVVFYDPDGFLLSNFKDFVDFYFLLKGWKRRFELFSLATEINIFRWILKVCIGK